MYKKHHIGKLSSAQISKLLNGHAVRVKHGNHHEVHLSVEQSKKVHKAHTKGKAAQIRFDPYQMQNHQHLRGKGSAKDWLAGQYNQIPESFHPGLESLGNAAIHELGLGLKKRGRPRKMRGGNVFDDIGNAFTRTFTPALGRRIAKGAIDYGIPAAVGGLTSMAGAPMLSPLTSGITSQFTGDIDRAVGLGLRRRGRPRKVRGGSIRDDMANFYDKKIPAAFHPGIESIGNAAIHELGFGLKKRGRPKGGSLLGKAAKAVLKPLAKQAAHHAVRYGTAAAGPAAAAAAVMAGQPELAPFAGMAANYIAREKAATAHNFIDGLGVRRRGRPRKHHGGALMAAGY